MADQETITLTRAQVEELRTIIHNTDSPLGNRLQDVSARLYFALEGAGWTPPASVLCKSCEASLLVTPLLPVHGTNAAIEALAMRLAPASAPPVAAVAQPVANPTLSDKYLRGEITWNEYQLAAETKRDQDDGAALAASPIAPQAGQSGDGWRMDHSAGRPILTFKNCSVIEAEDAEYVLRLISADQAGESGEELKPPKGDDPVQWSLFWLDSALQCKGFVWDGDQWTCANEALKAALSAQAAPTAVATLDSNRLRWLLSGHTVEELARHAQAGTSPETTPQDELIGLLGAWYCTLEEGLDTIDKAMQKANAAKPEGETPNT